MIIFVSTVSHKYTHGFVSKSLNFVRQMSYPVLLARRRLPKATYIFTDFDRLNFWQLELAANVYRQLQAAGCRVLNDPAQALSRLTLLQRLRRIGLNTFCVWPADQISLVDRFPVFIRTISAHRGNLSDLLHNKDELERALKSYISEGWPISDLMISEYRAEPLDGDIFRKLAVHRVGDAFFHAPSTHERHWVAKYGERGVAREAAYAADLKIVRDNPYIDAVEKAFNAAEIAYGRADCALVGGRIEIYEINTNPSMEPWGTHPFPDRLKAIQLFETGYDKAMHALNDTPTGPAIKIKRPDTFTPRHKYLRLLPGHQWTP